jgi:hypothetical protein
MVWVGFAATVLVGSGWFLGSNHRAVLRQRIVDAEAWRIEGAPCPTGAEAQFLRPHQKPLRRFTFQDVTFFRRHGHVSCAAIRDRGGRGDRLHAVCQFTSPGDLMIRTRSGDWYFRPGPGRSATVSTATGAPRCVMASQFSLRPPGV